MKKSEKRVYESRKKAAAKWDKENSRSITLKCYYKSDADILGKLDEVGNRQTYIKSLIRADIARQDEPTETD